VSVNGLVHRDFDEQSVVIATTPAEIVCQTTGSP